MSPSGFSGREGNTGLIGSSRVKEKRAPFDARLTQTTKLNPLCQLITEPAETSPTNVANAVSALKEPADEIMLMLRQRSNGFFNDALKIAMEKLDQSLRIERLIITQLVLDEEDEPYDQQHWHHEWDGEAADVAEEAGGMGTLLIGDGFYHEIGSVTDVCVRAEENGAHRNRYNELVESRIA